MGGTAWVTLATNDSYALGALVVANSLKRVNTVHDLAILITPGVTLAMKNELLRVFSFVKEVDVFDSRDETNLRLLARPDLGITFTKIHAWRLTQYSKCVFLDADVLIVQNCDELFDREELSAAPDAGWPDCFNSGVFVFKPSDSTYNALVEFALVHGSFDGGDQGLLNLYFSGWSTGDSSKRLPFVYNMCSTTTYSYLPALKQFGSQVKVIHFIGSSKPWLQHFDPSTRAVLSGDSHLNNFLQLWWDVFVVHVHPTLTAEMAGLARALAQVPLGTPISAEQLAYEDHIHRQHIEEGHIDYLGKDSWDNIWKHISQTIDPPKPVEDPAQPESASAPSAAVEVASATPVVPSQPESASLVLAPAQSTPPVVPTPIETAEAKPESVASPIESTPAPSAAVVPPTVEASAIPVAPVAEAPKLDADTITPAVPTPTASEPVVTPAVPAVTPATAPETPVASSPVVSEPTSTPTVVPVGAPAPATSEPSPVPVPTPVVAPVETPVIVPVETPIVAPVEAPATPVSPLPTPAPTTPPVESPVLPPTPDASPSGPSETPVPVETPVATPPTPIEAVAPAKQLEPVAVVSAEVAATPLSTEPQVAPTSAPEAAQEASPAAETSPSSAVSAAIASAVTIAAAPAVTPSTPQVTPATPTVTSPTPPQSPLSEVASKLEKLDIEPAIPEGAAASGEPPVPPKRKGSKDSQGKGGKGKK